MNGKLHMMVFNVQSANCIWLSTPNNMNFVFDIGIGREASGKVFNPLSYIYRKGVRTIDALVITHPHSDHVEGIDLLQLFSVKTMWYARGLSRRDIIAGNPYGKANWVDIYLRCVAAMQTTVYAWNSPFNPANNGGVDVKTFSQTNTSPSNLNNRSIVSIIQYLGFKIMLPGDAEPAAFGELLQDRQFTAAIKDVTVMVVPHHGRVSGYCGEVFKYFSPMVCVISDGEAQETDATSYYSQRCSGVNVRAGKHVIQTNRKCLTTRTDGAMLFEFFKENQPPYDNYFTIDTHI